MEKRITQFEALCRLKAHMDAARTLIDDFWAGAALKEVVEPYILVSISCAAMEVNNLACSIQCELYDSTEEGGDSSDEQ